MRWSSESFRPGLLVLRRQHSCVQNAKPPMRAKYTIFPNWSKTHYSKIPQQHCFCPDTEEITGHEASVGSRHRLESWKKDEFVGAKALCLLEHSTGHCTDAPEEPSLIAQMPYRSLSRCKIYRQDCCGQVMHQGPRPRVRVGAEV